jgi:hypothetical protein
MLLRPRRRRILRVPAGDDVASLKRLIDNDGCKFTFAGLTKMRVTLTIATPSRQQPPKREQ